MSSKNLLPLRGGENSEHLSIFCDGPASYLDPLPLLQELDDRLIAERVFLVFFVDELLDGLLDALAGDVLVGDAPDARIEEVLQFEEPLWGVDVLVRGHPR